MNNSVLVVDDDNKLRILLQQFLQKHHFNVIVAKDAIEAEQQLIIKNFDIVILDVMMPNVSGVQFANKIRNTNNSYKNIPILMLTAKGEDQDKINGLIAGADDYLIKPFNPQELVLRIQKILSRTKQTTKDHNKVTFSHLTYDIDKRILLNNEGAIIDLTPMEGELLYILAKNPRTVLARIKFAEQIKVGLNPRTVDVQIARLRKKIENHTQTARCLRTIRHKGYVLWTD